MRRSLMIDGTQVFCHHPFEDYAMWPAQRLLPGAGCARTMSGTSFNPVFFRISGETQDDVI
jgi:hypothetical protein